LVSVRDRTNAAILEPKKNGQARWQDPNVHAAQTELERLLGVRVRIADRKGKGKIVIEYASLEDFDRVVEMLKGKS
jgi:ParB family chromosome partitioning protein